MVKFFDMDGTLAKFYYHPQYLERMYERGYFRNLKPYKLVNYVRECIEKGDKVVILTACIDSPYCKHEKRTWLHEFIPELSEDCYIFVKQGESKAAAAERWAIEHSINGGEWGEAMVLIDDYGVNIDEWNNYSSKFAFYGVKYFNGINGTKKKKYKYSFKTVAQLRKLLAPWED